MERVQHDTTRQIREMCISLLPSHVLVFLLSFFPSFFCFQAKRSSSKSARRAEGKERSKDEDSEEDHDDDDRDDGDDACAAEQTQTLTGGRFHMA